NVAGSSGPQKVSATFAPSMKLVEITTGTNFGPPIKDNVKMHPSAMERGILAAALNWARVSNDNCAGKLSSGPMLHSWIKR
ncbi:MAG: hypothetical protein WBS33_09700, partial [Verrucomicrobiia bacterium]